MRKLISKDPVQRYKLGKKIIKAYNGDSITFRNTDFYYNTPDGREYKMNSDWFRPTTPDSSDLSTNYNRKYVRSQRNNYSNVDDYYNYIMSNQNSNEGKLWNRILGTLETPQAKRQAFDEIMNTYGIKGNLGRRDSKRLSNVMNTIKGIATDKNELDNYLNSYQDQYTRGIINNSLTPYFDVSKIQWRSTPSNPEEQNYSQQVLNFINSRSPYSYASRGIKQPGNMTYGEWLGSNNAYDLSRFNLFNKFKTGGVLKAQKGMTFKQAFDKARAEGNRFFFYDDGTGIKTYNTMTAADAKNDQTRALWAKKFKDNLTVSGQENMQTSINRGWDNYKGASHGRYNSKGEYVKFKDQTPYKYGTDHLAVKGDYINDNGDRSWALADLPGEAVDLGRGTNRGKHGINEKTGLEVGKYNTTVQSGIMELMPWQKVGNSRSPKNEIKIGNTTYKRGMLYNYPGYYNNQTGYFTRGNDIYLRSLKDGKYQDQKVGVIKNGEQYYSSDSDNIVTYDEYRKFLGADKNKFMGQDILKSDIVIPQEMPSFNDMRNKYNVAWHKNTHFKNFK